MVFIMMHCRRGLYKQERRGISGVACLIGMAFVAFIAYFFGFVDGYVSGRCAEVNVVNEDDEEGEEDDE